MCRSTLEPQDVDEVSGCGRRQGRGVSVSVCGSVVCIYVLERRCMMVPKGKKRNNHPPALCLAVPLTLPKHARCSSAGWKSRGCEARRRRQSSGLDPRV